MPLPPRMSRAMAHTRRAASPVFSLASAACSIEIRPCACSCDILVHISCMPVMSLSMCESLSWISWNRAQRAPELLTPQGVGQGGLVGGDGVAEGLPGHGLPGFGQHVVGVVPGARLRQPCIGRYPDPVEADLGLPDPAVRRLPGDLPGVIPGDRVLRAVGMLDHE